MAISISRTLLGGGKWKCTQCGAKGTTSDYDSAQEAGLTHQCSN